MQAMLPAFRTSDLTLYALAAAFSLTACLVNNFNPPVWVEPSGNWIDVWSQTVVQVIKAPEPISPDVHAERIEQARAQI